MIVEVQHMEELLKQIGTRIRTRRKQLRLSQEQLAEMAGITPQTVSTAELGQKAMRPGTTIRISFWAKSPRMINRCCAISCPSFHRINTVIWKTSLTAILRL